MTLDQCEATFDAIRFASSSDSLTAAYRSLLTVYPVISFELARASTFWRGRKCESNRGYLGASDLSYPPAKQCKTGRLNDEGSPCLYATQRKSTVFSELSLQDGDYVHVVGLRIKPAMGVRFIALGELFHVYKTGYMRTIGSDPDQTLSRLLNSHGLEEGKRILFIDAFFAALLSDPNAKENDYTLTRTLASEAYKKIVGTEGLFYPSVQDHVGMCIAVHPTAYDTKMHIVCSQVIQISRVRAFGFFDYEVCFEAKGINDSGEFVWQKPASRNAERFFGLTKEEVDLAQKRGRLGSNDNAI